LSRRRTAGPVVARSVVVSGPLVLVFEIQATPRVVRSAGYGHCLRAIDGALVRTQSVQASVLKLETLVRCKVVVLADQRGLLPIYQSHQTGVGHDTAGRSPDPPPHCVALLYISFSRPLESLKRLRLSYHRRRFLHRPPAEPAKSSTELQSDEPQRIVEFSLSEAANRRSVGTGECRGTDYYQDRSKALIESAAERRRQDMALLECWSRVSGTTHNSEWTPLDRQSGWLFDPPPMGPSEPRATPTPTITHVSFPHAVRCCCPGTRSILSVAPAGEGRGAAVCSRFFLSKATETLCSI